MQPIYNINFDFDDASSSWLRNKKRNKNGIYYYICEKTFTKKNLNEFMLFLIQIFIKYLFTHKLHNYYIDHSETINSKIALLQHSIHVF